MTQVAEILVQYETQWFLLKGICADAFFRWIVSGRQFKKVLENGTENSTNLRMSVCASSAMSFSVCVRGRH